MTIEEFSIDPKEIMATAAFMKVARDQGDSAEQIIAGATADILFRYFKKPARPASEASPS